MSAFGVDDKPNTLYMAFDSWNASRPSNTVKPYIYESVATLKAIGIGRTIFASYNDKTGWSLKELGGGNQFFAWIARILRTCGVAYKETVLTEKQKLDLLAALVDDTMQTVLTQLQNAQETIDDTRQEINAINYNIKMKKNHKEMRDEVKGLNTKRDELEKFLSDRKAAAKQLLGVDTEEASLKPKDEKGLKPFVNWLKIKL